MPGHYNAAPQNHHYGKRKGESVKQERMDLLKDNPVVRDMTSNRPWMSKHFKSTMSPLRDGHGESPAQGNAFTKANVMFIRYCPKRGSE